jgi:hypothetical protein
MNRLVKPALVRQTLRGLAQNGDLTNRQRGRVREFLRQPAEIAALADAMAPSLRTALDVAGEISPSADWTLGWLWENREVLLAHVLGRQDAG